MKPFKVVIIDNGPSAYSGVRFTAHAEEWDLGEPIASADLPITAVLDLMQQYADREADEEIDRLVRAEEAARTGIMDAELTQAEIDEIDRRLFERDHSWESDNPSLGRFRRRRS